MAIKMTFDKYKEKPVCNGQTTFINEMITAMPNRDFLIVDERDPKIVVKAWIKEHPYGIVIYGER